MKKYYQKPSMKVVTLKNRKSLLLGSTPEDYKGPLD